ncbi:unnamed protein product [Heterosigma akashiwo]
MGTWMCVNSYITIALRAAPQTTDHAPPRNRLPAPGAIWLPEPPLLSRAAAR